MEIPQIQVAPRQTPCEVGGVSTFRQTMPANVAQTLSTPLGAGVLRWLELLDEMEEKEPRPPAQSTWEIAHYSDYRAYQSEFAA